MARGCGFIRRIGPQSNIERDAKLGDQETTSRDRFIERAPSYASDNSDRAALSRSVPPTLST